MTGFKLMQKKIGQLCNVVGAKATRGSSRCYNCSFKNSTVLLILQLQCNVHPKAVLDDSLITVKTSLDQHKLCYCTITRNLCEVYDDIMVLIWKFAWDMPMNVTKGNECHAIYKQLSSCFLYFEVVTQSEGLRYPLLILEWLCFFPSTDLNTASSGKLLFTSVKLYLNISSDLLTCCDETTKEFTSYAEKPKRNKLKIANKLLIVTSDEINLQSKHDLICHVAKMKAATSEHNFYG